MRPLILRITLGLATIALGPAFPQGGGIGVGAGLAGGIMAGPGGMISQSVDDNGMIFTYNFPRGATVFAVTGAAYSGHTSSQTLRTLANGTHLTQQSFDQPMTYRDSMGRTRTDVTTSPQPALPNRVRIPEQINRLAEIIDPVAGYEYILDPVHQVAHRVVIQARQNQAPMNAAAAARPMIAQPERTMENGSTVKIESLATQTIFGIPAVGQRNTTTYPVGTYEGNDQPVMVMNETWRSVQYSLMLRSLNSGPNGDRITTMKDFSTDEPDPALFQVPAGYQVVDEKGEFSITIPRGVR